MRSRTCIPWLLTLALGVTPATSNEPPTGRTAPAPSASSRWLLGSTYTIEASFSFHAALLHWLDSLCGLDGRGFTAGKTVEAHRDEYQRRIGPPSAEDRRQLARFAHARRATRAATDPESPDAVTTTFFETTSLEDALGVLRPSFDPALVEELASSLRYFVPRYRRVWRDGAIPRKFLARVARDPRRAEVGSYLVSLSDFFGVATSTQPRPRLHVFPVARGWGTHAQAIGHHLLIEVRVGDGLLEQLTPIVHENAHLLAHRMAPASSAGLETFVGQAGPSARRAWRTLAEALPTALAQGEAGRRFDPRWSTERPWYHTAEVDSYAKRLHPVVREALAQEEHFDPAFLARALVVYAGTDPPTRRSP